MKTRIEQAFDDFARPLENTDKESFQVIDRHKKKIDYELNHMTERLLATHKKRHDMVRGQIGRTASFLFPEGNFQERVLSPIYFVNKFGPNIFQNMEIELDLNSFGHQLIEVEP